jgi:hypothetical protein
MSSTTTRLQLHLSAKNLKNLGGGRSLFGGTSDPFAVVTVRGDNSQNKPVVVGQTDVYVSIISVSIAIDLFIFCSFVGAIPLPCL